MTPQTPVTSDIRTREVELADGLRITLEERGQGRPMLVLHGGSGPRLMAPLAAALAPQAHVLLPTHPGFGQTPRPEWCDTVADLAMAYSDLLARLDLRDVLVIGQSMGGWIASEMVLRGDPRVSGVVLLNAVGVLVEGHPIADALSLSPAQLSALSFHNPERFRIDPSTMSPEQLAGLAANRAALAAYASSPYMHDPKLLRRLKRAHVPALVLWGESDGVVDVEYGRAFAGGFRQSQFERVPKAGHFPHLEQPEQVLKHIWAFAAKAAPLGA